MDESLVYLTDGGNGAPVEARLCDEIRENHLRQWNEKWLRDLRGFGVGRDVSDRPEDSHWDWRLTAESWRKPTGDHGFALLCCGELQGLMVCSDGGSARIPGQFGKPLIHIRFLAAAPWNRPEFQSPPRYLGVGPVLLLAAIETSRAIGAEGRIGLHALPAAAAFYQRKCGMTFLGADAARHQFLYFEMDEKQADAFRQTRTRP